MARFLLVLKPLHPATRGKDQQSQRDLLARLDPVLLALKADVDHRTTAHLGALLREIGENQRMQLFADVQSKPEGLALELVLMSSESMGVGAPETRSAFEHLVQLSTEYLPDLELVFRSDQDGALPSPATK
jgi:hypothetical protein